MLSILAFWVSLGVALASGEASHGVSVDDEPQKAKASATATAAAEETVTASAMEIRAVREPSLSETMVNAPPSTVYDDSEGGRTLAEEAAEVTWDSCSCGSDCKDDRACSDCGQSCPDDCSARPSGKTCPNCPHQSNCNVHFCNYTEALSSTSVFQQNSDNYATIHHYIGTLSDTVTQCKGLRGMAKIPYTTAILGIGDGSKNYAEIDVGDGFNGLTLEMNLARANASWLACAQRCEDHTECTYWTLEPTHPKPKCRLKKDILGYACAWNNAPANWIQGPRCSDIPQSVWSVSANSGQSANSVQCSAPRNQTGVNSNPSLYATANGKNPKYISLIDGSVPGNQSQVTCSARELDGNNPSNACRDFSSNNNNLAMDQYGWVKGECAWTGECYGDLEKWACAESCANTTGCTYWALGPTCYLYTATTTDLSAECIGDCNKDTFAEGKLPWKGWSAMIPTRRRGTEGTSNDRKPGLQNDDPRFWLVGDCTRPGPSAMVETTSQGAQRLPVPTKSVDDESQTAEANHASRLSIVGGRQAALAMD